MPNAHIWKSQRKNLSDAGGDHRFRTSRHGSNIRLFENATVATRTASFNDALVFTERSLQPNELFLVEIERNHHGWNGSLRIGITHDPEMREKLPQYSIPGLTTDGSAWVYTLDRTEVDDQLRSAWTIPECKMQKLLRLSPHGRRLNFESLLPREIPSKKARYFSSRKNSHNDEFQARLVDNLPRLLNDDISGGINVPTYEGSRVGMFYTEESADLIFLYFILNGDTRGPFPFEVLEDAQLFVVCDVYGYTQTIRILPVYQVPSLKSICREKIISCAQNLEKLPIAPKLTRYLTYQPSQ